MRGSFTRTFSLCVFRCVFTVHKLAVASGKQSSYSSHDTSFSSLLTNGFNKLNCSSQGSLYSILLYNLLAY
jgi:hypothetical protein